MNTARHLLMVVALVLSGCSAQVDAAHGCDADGAVYVVDDGQAHDYAVRYQAANGILVKTTDANAMPPCIPGTMCLVATSSDTMDGLCR